VFEEILDSGLLAEAEECRLDAAFDPARLESRAEPL
jgi:hypothetical protein